MWALATSFDDGVSSDYGSDFDIDEATRLLEKLQAAGDIPALVNHDNLSARDVEFGFASDAATSALPSRALSQHKLQSLDEWPAGTSSCKQAQQSPIWKEAEISKRLVATQESRIQHSIATPAQTIGATDRFESPLQRFRTPPKKPLSVTDIVSPAWCELQYLKNLEKYGRVKRTAAMRKGSEVHQKLEDEVHQKVLVEVQSREDRFGLRIWNAIQGLRTLRVKGMTRELETWAIFEGHLVNGVIDKLSVTVARSDSSLHSNEQDEQPDAFPPLNEGRHESPLAPTQTISITDVKTRGGRSLPRKSNMRSARMQLMLYYKMLAQIVSGRVDCRAVFERYDIDSSVMFSDSLISQLSALEMHLRCKSTAKMSTHYESNIDLVLEMTQHNNVQKLWDLMIDEYRLCMPLGLESVSRILSVEFRYGDTGDVLGSMDFTYQGREIDAYLLDELRWWRGERSTKGVEIEEAFKCSICEYADDCEWRLQRASASSMRPRGYQP